MQDKFDIIVVNYKTYFYLNLFLKSIYIWHSKWIDKIVIVDYQYDEFELKKIVKKFPLNIKAYGFLGNYGYAWGINFGYKYINPRKWFIVTNPDIIILPNFFEHIINCLKEDIGLIVPKVLNPDFSWQPSLRKFPYFKYLLFGRESFFTKMFPKNPISFDYLELNRENVEGEAQVGTGMFMILNSQIFEKVGKMNNKYFLFAEDVDLCYRIRKAGFKVYYCPKVKVIHFWGKSREYAKHRSKFWHVKSVKIFIQENVYPKFKFLFDILALFKYFCIAFENLFRP